MGAFTSRAGFWTSIHTTWLAHGPHPNPQLVHAFGWRGLATLPARSLFESLTS
jgi:hypothetical protein